MCLIRMLLELEKNKPPLDAPVQLITLVGWGRPLLSRVAFPSPAMVKLWQLLTLINVFMKWVPLSNNIIVFDVNETLELLLYQSNVWHSITSSEHWELLFTYRIRCLLWTTWKHSSMISWNMVSFNGDKHSCCCCKSGSNDISRCKFYKFIGWTVIQNVLSCITAYANQFKTTNGTCIQYINTIYHSLIDSFLP